MLDELLTKETVGDYLRRQGLLASGPAVVRELSGGVSSVVIAAEQGARRLIVKQSLERLKVAREWHAPRTRILAEGAALTVTADIVPHAVPRVISTDADRLVLVIDEAPEGWRDWKSRLMTGEVDVDVARRLGDAVARMHRTTDAAPLPAVIEAQDDMFRQLRLDPYHGEVARRLPHLKDHVNRAATALRSGRCLVHGDLSPKNILTSDDADLWLIDFEVAHRGDPVFDVAFLLSHLLLKAIHLPHHAPRLAQAGVAFADAYAASWPSGAPGEDLSAQVGCLVLARVFGTSPVEYLSPAEQHDAARVGETLLTGRPTSVSSFFELVREP